MASQVLFFFFLIVADLESNNLCLFLIFERSIII